jgi:O-antigen ligase
MYAPRAGADPRRGAFLPLVATLGLAVLAGIATAMAGDVFGPRAAYFLAVFGAIGIGALVAVTREEPVRFVFLCLIAGLPIANATVPPGRFGITVFDVVMTVLAITLIAKAMVASDPRGAPPLFPTRSLAIAWLLVVPCVVLSQFPGISLIIVVLTFALYAFFVLALAELERVRGFERLVFMLSGLLVVMAVGALIDHTWHVNLSLRGANLNQLTYLAGLEIYRAAGFFQDPQRCGAFFAALITFLLVLVVRGRFMEAPLRLVVWLAIFAGLAALPLTISRSAILACVVMSAAALFAFNAWSWHVKAAIAGAALVVAMLLAQTSFDPLLGVLPATVKERFLQAPEEFANRVAIWFDTWDMFADHPLNGIGLGSFRWYLLATRPGVSDYYDIGADSVAEYVPDQPESGYLKVLYEGGIVGSLAALLLAGDAVRRALDVAIAAGPGRDPNARTECIAALAALGTFGVTFTTQFTMGDPRVGALLAFLLAVIWRRSLERSRSVEDAPLERRGTR